MRFRILTAVVLLAGALQACSGSQAEPVPGTAVVTEGGTVQARATEHNALRWLDIPYARPPLGPLRWRAPQPLAASSASLAPASAPVLCPQAAGETSGTSGEGIVGTEDCLYLDIAAPLDYAGRQYPVMFWIHGGANTSGHKGSYDFSALAARQQVVVVTINYRLGPLGWFTHPALQSQAKGLDRSGNFGTLDIIAALEWTQRNIGAFGGDPDKVTIFGESAGGRNVYSMLASPLSEGLFHRAIAQSPTVQSFSPEQAYNPHKRFASIDRGAWEVVEALDLDNADVSAGELRALPASTLLERYLAIDKDHAEPLIVGDGVVIPEEGLLEALADPRYAKHVPVMAGSNRDEVTLWLGLNRYFVKADRLLFGVLPPRVRIREPELFEYWVRQRARAWKARAVDAPLAQLQKAGYADLYAYRFDWDEQADNWFIAFSEVLGAAHASEIAFVMGAPMYGSVGEYMYPDTDSAQAMTGQMMQAWGEFARSGSPGPFAGAPWPRYSSEAPLVAVLDAGEQGPRTLSDSPGLEGLLDELAAAQPPLDERETCMLLWEMLTTVSDADYAAYSAWRGGACRQVDVPAEKAAVRAALIEEYGSADIF